MCHRMDWCRACSIGLETSWAAASVRPVHGSNPQSKRVKPMTPHAALTEMMHWFFGWQRAASMATWVEQSLAYYGFKIVAALPATEGETTGMMNRRLGYEEQDGDE
jgi:hypothetical protein